MRTGAKSARPFSQIQKGNRMTDTKRKRGFAAETELGLVVGQIVIIRTEAGKERGRVTCLRPFGKIGTVYVKTLAGHYIVPAEKAEIV